MCKFGRRNCITVKVQEKSVAVKGQGIFFILTEFDRSCSSEYRFYGSPLSM